jgi:cytoskeletal protein CcmA (bactofilin family)
MKFAKSQNTPAPTDLRSFLGEGTEIVGEIKFTEIMRLDAIITGTIHSETGALLIMDQGLIKGDIDAGSVEVGGTVLGKITARTSVKILSTGRVTGDIFTPALIIEYGAVFEGKCSMLSSKSEGEDVTRIEKKPDAETHGLKVADTSRSPAPSKETPAIL